MDNGLDMLAILSVFLGLENLEENRQQSAQQERILHEITAKFDRLEKLVEELRNNGTVSPRNHDDG